MPGMPAGFNDPSPNPFLPPYAQSLRGQAPASLDLDGSPEAMKRAVMQRAIWNNRKTGGRHPDAAPLKGDPPKEDQGPAEEPTTGGRDTAPPRAGGDANAKGTQMGGINSSGLAAFEKLLQEREGIQFNFNTSQLPTSAKHKEQVDKPREMDLSSMPQEAFVEYQTKGTAEGGDRADRAQLRQSLDFHITDDSGIADNWGQEDQVFEYSKPKGINRSRRGAAFLDYKGNSMMAKRAADAAQGTIVQNGKTYGKGADGEWTRINDKAAAELRNVGTGIATSAFVTDNAYTAPSAEETAQSTLARHVAKNKDAISHGEATMEQVLEPGYIEGMPAEAFGSRFGKDDEED